MDFSSAVLLQLADPVTRTNFFQQSDLEHLASVAFDVEGMTLSGPYSAVFDELSFGFPLPSTSVIEGHIGRVGGADRYETRLTITGLAQATALRVDALWRGRIVARTVPSLVPIEKVDFEWVDEHIDQQILAQLGALPSEPLLENERRKRLIAAVGDTLSLPGKFDEISLERWLARMGVTTVGEALERRGTFGVGAVHITFAPSPEGIPAPKPLPFAAAIMIRDSDVSIAKLLVESRAVREQLAAIGLEMSTEPWVRKRAPFVIVWIVPSTLFDDAGWPGPSTAVRQQRAAQWLAEHGIGLVVRNI